MTDELTRAIAEATEGRQREGTAKWPECCRDTYSLAIEEIAAALAPLIVQREQRAFDRGYDKAMEGIEARVREARAEELEKFAGALDGQFPERSGSLMGRLVNPSIRQVAEVARTWAEEVRRG